MCIPFNTSSWMVDLTTFTSRPLSLKVKKEKKDNLQQYSPNKENFTDVYKHFTVRQLNFGSFFRISITDWSESMYRMYLWKASSHRRQPRFWLVTHIALSTASESLYVRPFTNHSLGTKPKGPLTTACQLYTHKLLLIRCNNFGFSALLKQGHVCGGAAGF